MSVQIVTTATGLWFTVALELGPCTSTSRIAPQCRHSDIASVYAGSATLLTHEACLTRE